MAQKQGEGHMIMTAQWSIKGSGMDRTSRYPGIARGVAAGREGMERHQVTESGRLVGFSIRI